MHWGISPVASLRPAPWLFLFDLARASLCPNRNSRRSGLCFAPFFKQCARPHSARPVPLPPETNLPRLSSFLAGRSRLVSSGSLQRASHRRVLASVPLRSSSSSNLLSVPPASVRRADYFRPPSLRSNARTDISARSTSGAQLCIHGSLVQTTTSAAAQTGESAARLIRPMSLSAHRRALRIARCLAASDCT